jgi:hypothetical protein
MVSCLAHNGSVELGSCQPIDAHQSSFGEDLWAVVHTAAAILDLLIGLLLLCDLCVCVRCVSSLFGSRQLPGGEFLGQLFPTHSPG